MVDLLFYSRKYTFCNRHNSFSKSNTTNSGLDLIENDPLPANSLETAFDKITAIAQEVQEEVNDQ